MVADRTLRARWPAHLAARIASRDFVLVVGAGASRGCTNTDGESPIGWEGLLKSLAKEFASGGARKAALELVKDGQFLDAAELVRSCARSAAKDQDFLRAIARLTDGDKMRPFDPRGLHDTLLRLEPEVILTTNYDRILERASRSGYKVHRYESTTLADDVRSGEPVLVKLHGSVDSASEMVLTRSDYTRLKRQGADVLEVVQALFLTRTVIFVGYGFGDPDIHLLLENVLGARGGVPAHYLVTSGNIPAYVEDIYRYSYGTNIIKFKAGDYEELERMLELLADLVDGYRADSALQPGFVS